MDKLINRVFGLTATSDEYRQKELFRIIAFSSAVVWIIATVYLIVRVSMILLTETRPSADLIFIAAIWYFYSLYLIVKVRKKKLDTIDVEEAEYPQQVRQLKRGSVKWGLFFGTGLIVGPAIIDLLTTGTTDMLKWNSLLGASVGGLLFGLFGYVYGKSRLTQ